MYKLLKGDLILRHVGRFGSQHTDVCSQTLKPGLDDSNFCILPVYKINVSLHTTILINKTNVEQLLNKKIDLIK